MTGGQVNNWLNGLGVQAILDAEASRVATETLATDWVARLNDGGINVALALGDRAALVAAIRVAADELEA